LDVQTCDRRDAFVVRDGCPDFKERTSLENACSIKEARRGSHASSVTVAIATAIKREAQVLSGLRDTYRVGIL
jgi:hypothetical protein